MCVLESNERLLLSEEKMRGGRESGRVGGREREGGRVGKEKCKEK